MSEALRKAAQAIIDYSEDYEAGKQDWPEWDAKFFALKAALAEPEQADPSIGTKSYYKDGKVVNEALRWSDVYADEPQPQEPPSNDTLELLRKVKTEMGLEPEQSEPVAWEWRYDSVGHAATNVLAITETPEPTTFLKNVFARGPFPLYAAPPRREPDERDAVLRQALEALEQVTK